MDTRLVEYRMPEVEILRDQTKLLLESAESMIVDCQEMFEIAADELRAVKKLAKEIEEQRKEAVAPLNEAVKAINALPKPAQEILAKAESIFKSKMAEFSDAQRQIAATVVDKETGVEVILAGSTEKPQADGISTRTVWNFSITDPSLIPREYMLVDEKKIAAVVRAMKGDTAIPGVTVYADTQIAARAA